MGMCRICRAFSSLEALQPALVSLAAAAAGDAVKRLMQAVLEKTRSEDAEVGEKWAASFFEGSKKVWFCWERERGRE